MPRHAYPRVTMITITAELESSYLKRVGKKASRRLYNISGFWDFHSFHSFILLPEGPPCEALPKRGINSLSV